MVKFYTNNCPKCEVVKTKLLNMKIKFEEINDMDLMLLKGFTTAPMLEVDEKIYGFSDAIKWIGEQCN